jgi:hypothetical protein
MSEKTIVMQGEQTWIDLARRYSGLRYPRTRPDLTIKIPEMSNNRENNNL